MTLPGEAEAAGGVGQEAGQDRRRRRGRRRRRRRDPFGPAGDAGRLPAARPADAAGHAVAGHPGGRDGAGRHLQGNLVLNFGTGYFLPRAVTRPVLDVLEFAI